MSTMYENGYIINGESRRAEESPISVVSIRKEDRL